MKKGFAVGLLGGSFNPAHRGHRRISLAALERLGLDEVWWLVSPQNPLKPVAGMAPFAQRLASARAVARHPRIRVSDAEAAFGTTHTVDSVAALAARHRHARFVWLMGADNLAQFHLWVAWRELAQLVPIVVFARPGYSWARRRAPALAWFGRRRGRPAQWRNAPLPFIAFLDAGLDPTSATALRRHNPHWLLRSSDGEDPTASRWAPTSRSLCA